MHCTHEQPDHTTNVLLAISDRLGFCVHLCVYGPKCDKDKDSKLKMELKEIEDGGKKQKKDNSSSLAQGQECKIERHCQL